MFQITFVSDVSNRCDFIGRTVWGVCAVVKRDGVEVFRSRAYGKRGMARKEAQDWVAGR